MAQSHCSSHDFIPGLLHDPLLTKGSLVLCSNSLVLFSQALPHSPKPCSTSTPELKTPVQAPCPFSPRALLGVAEAGSFPAYSFIPQSFLKDFPAARIPFQGSWKMGTHCRAPRTSQVGGMGTHSTSPRWVSGGAG